jgi:SecD/SecF fusion protein
MLNDSVNQTMSRTILTSGTVFIVVVILYFFGGPGIHAFAFSLVIGVISGTYSTVYIASPLLLWLFERGNPQPTGKLERREVSKSVA